MNSSKRARVVVPIAFDLEKEGDAVVLGKGTQKACDEAIGGMWEFLREDPHTQVRILVSATNAPAKYGHVIMGRLMGDYINHELDLIQRRTSKMPNTVVCFQQAPEFSTIGEILALKEYLVAEGITDCELIVGVKDWHALRVMLVIWSTFIGSGIRLRIRMRTHEFPIPIREQLKEMGKAALTVPVVFQKRIAARKKVLVQAA